MCCDSRTKRFSSTTVRWVAGVERATQAAASNPSFNPQTRSASVGSRRLTSPTPYAMVSPNLASCQAMKR